mmetsp:Transcript_53593/g.107401  ORF Transcript_53593/g.107401 Transcript_53593/m.107401 type:complete len:179 (-) Transcript_53593:1218-1754(-)
MKNFLLVDGKGHLFGRLASLCAKEVLNGRKVVILRSDKIEISGRYKKNKFKMLSKFKKRTNTNPKHGPFHFQNPSRILWKGIRGMLPHKIKKGTNALKRLRIYEGVPLAFSKMKKVIVPAALRVLKLSPSRKFSLLGEIAHEIGWSNKPLLDQLDEKMQVINRKFFLQKKKKKKKCFL